MPRSRESQHSSGPGAPAGEADAAPPAPSDDRIRAESAAEHPLEAPGEDWSVLPRPAERTAPPRIQILSPAPMIDCGRFAAKRTVGEWVDVSADVFRDGHEIVRAVVRYRGPGDEDWREAPMRWIDREVDGDRWASAFEVDRVGRWEFTFEAWSDLLATWRDELRRKLEAGQHDLRGELSEGVVTLEEFDRLVRDAREHGLEIALDFAIQCSADHPWLREHPEWFNRRPDGTLKYAENPPKRYQDIFNVNWDCEDWQGLWNALRDVLMVWVERGVRIFRVDNPHTKPLAFWEWLITEVRARYPDVILLSEAFTRRVKLRALAKAGFSQSYTYFTWKNSRHELTEYMHELAHSGMQEYCRPNFFANTPDILNEYLVHGGPPAFVARLVLAATLSPTYGIYSGFEQFENVPVAPGSEEYLNSEKYEIKRRDLDGPLLPMIARINRIRRENVALQHLSNITFLETENEGLIAYHKRWGDNVVIVVVCLDPHVPQEGVAVVPAWLGLPPAFAVEDMLDGERYDWRLGRNYVRLGPGERMAHVLRI